jgi:hypothetical protein
MLGLGAGAAAAVVLGDPAPAPAEALAAPDGPFDLSGPATRWIQDKRLHHTTVMQSFAFDERHRHIYALQVVRGGVRLPGESRSYTHAERSKAGDLVLNRLSRSGDRLGHMYLKGFGHGTAMGVEETADGGTALWTECDANPASGYGRAIGRFRYVAGAVLHSGHRSVVTYRPRPGSTANSAALDLHGRRVLLRYRTRGRRRYALYDLDAFARGRFRPLTDFPQPGAELGLPFQGMTLYGNYAYQMIGSAHDPDNPSADGGDTLLHAIDLRTAQVVEEQRTWAAEEPVLREPEGLAVLRSTTPRLCMGFASGPLGGRTYSLYYKESSS